MSKSKEFSWSYSRRRAASSNVADASLRTDALEQALMALRILSGDAIGETPNLE